jgi:hypothetical protein
MQEVDDILYRFHQDLFHLQPGAFLYRLSQEQDITRVGILVYAAARRLDWETLLPQVLPKVLNQKEEFLSFVYSLMLNIRIKEMKELFDKLYRTTENGQSVLLKIKH